MLFFAKWLDMSVVRERSDQILFQGVLGAKRQGLAMVVHLNSHLVALWWRCKTGDIISPIF